MRAIKPSLFEIPGRQKSFGVRLRHEGKYRYQYFATERERRGFVAKVAAEIQAEGRALTPAERSWLKIISIAAQNSGIAEANVAPWLFELLQQKSVALTPKRKDEAAPEGATPITQAVALFIADIEKRNLRPDSLAGYKRTLGWFEKEIGVPHLAALTRHHLINWITKRYKAEASRETLRSLIVPFLNSWAEKQEISRDVFTKLTWPRVRADENSPVWATPDMVTKLLREAPDDLRPALALGAFAGIRPEEVQRITWDQVDFAMRQIRLPGTMTKIRKPRLLYDLPEVIWNWLELTPKKHREGKVYPKAERAWRRDFALTLTAAKIKPWPKDALRKGFATHAAVLKGRDWTVNIMGHVDERLLEEVYRGAVSSDVAKEYFALTPAKVFQGATPSRPSRYQRPKAGARASSKTSRPTKTAEPPSAP